MKKRMFILICSVLVVVIGALLVLLFDLGGFLADYSCDRAQQHWEEGDAAGALSEYRFALRMRPGHKRARLGLADVYASVGDGAQSEDTLKTGLLWDPDEYDYYAALFKIYRDRDEVTPAFELLSAAQGGDARHGLAARGPQPVKVSPRGGEYTMPVFVTLSSDARIYYTLDGKPLSYDSVIYGGEIMLGRGTHTLRAFAADENGFVSMPVEETYTVQYSSTRLYFGNPKIERMARYELDIPEGTLYNTSTFYLRDLSSTHEGEEIIGSVYSLRDLRWMANLRSLSLSGEQYIDDFAPLGRLYTLETLNLAGCAIDDGVLVHIALLERLQSLSLRGNHITDIAPLGQLTGLTSLDLSGNGIISVEPLATMRELTRLNLDSNRIQNLKPIVSLPKLTELSLQDNGITDARPLWFMDGLRSLDLRGNYIEDLSGIASMKVLETLNISGNPVISLFPLAELTELRGLSLSGCPVTSLAALQGRALDALDLSMCNIGDASMLSALAGVRSLNLQDNPLEDIAPVAAVPGLTVLNIERCPVEDLQPLLDCETLAELYCAGSNVTPGMVRELEDNGVAVYS